MTDEIDIATEIAAMHLRRALSERKPTGPRATGLCLECGDSVEDGRRWCDSACSMAYDAARAKRMQT